MTTPAEKCHCGRYTLAPNQTVIMEPVEEISPGYMHGRAGCDRPEDAVSKALRGIVLELSTKHELDQDDLARSCLPGCWVCKVLVPYAATISRVV